MRSPCSISARVFCRHERRRWLEVPKATAADSAPNAASSHWPSSAAAAAADIGTATSSEVMPGSGESVAAPASATTAAAAAAARSGSSGWLSVSVPQGKAAMAKVAPPTSQRIAVAVGQAPGRPCCC
jgi:hypothetical protein